jgi:hypothetical protein
LGVLLAALAWNLASETIRFRMNARSADGVVVRQETALSRDSDNRVTTMYAGVVQFEAEGRRFEVMQHIASGSPTYAQGATVRVLYPPGDPAQGRIDEPLDLFFMPVLVGIIAAVCVGFAAVPWIVRFKAR